MKRKLLIVLVLFTLSSTSFAQGSWTNGTSSDFTQKYVAGKKPPVQTIVVVSGNNNGYTGYAPLPRFNGFNVGFNPNYYNSYYSGDYYDNSDVYYDSRAGAQVYWDGVRARRIMRERQAAYDAMLYGDSYCECPECLYRRGRSRITFSSPTDWFFR